MPLQLFILLIAALAAGGAWADATPSAVVHDGAETVFEPRPFVATYQVRAGIFRGRLTLELEHLSGDDWLMTSRGTTRGLARMVRRGELVERARLRFTDNGIQPLEYEREDGISGPERNASLQFLAETERVVGTDREEEVDLPLDGGLHDRLSIQLQLMRDLVHGLRREAYQVVDRGDIREMEVGYVGIESITVADREYAALALDHRSSNSSRSTRLWCASEFQYLPIRIQQTRRGSTEWTGTLQEVQWGEVPADG